MSDHGSVSPVGFKNSFGWNATAVEAAVTSESPVRWRPPLLLSAVYLAACRVLGLVVFLGRGDREKELEILVLRHEPSILRRQISRPNLEVRDRVLLGFAGRTE